MSLRTTLLASAVGLFACASAHAAVFDLSTVANNTSVPFSITNGGVTATFSSTAPFAVQNTAGLLTFSPALVDNNFFGSNDVLTISFSRPIYNQITIPFAINDAFGFGPDTLSVTTSNGRSLSFSATPTNLPLGEPQGLVSFVPLATGLTSLTLTSQLAFDIGNVTVPEPMSLSLLGMGLFGLAATRRRA